MPISTLCAVVLMLTGGQLQPLPTPVYQPAAVPGQREIALGAQLQQDVTMEVRFEKDVPAEFSPGKILGDALLIGSLGYVRWSVKDGSLFDIPCRIVKMDGLTKGAFTFKNKRKEYTTGNTTTYWVTKEGKVLRQSVRIVDPDETKVAESVFASDHIDVSVSDRKGRRSFTVYPSIDLSQVDNQFKPMIEGQKVVLSEKEFVVFDPFDQGFTKYKATVGGEFHGTWFATKFDGIHVDIEGPRGKVVAFVSKEGDLVKVELTDKLSLVLNSLPASRDPMIQQLGGGTGKIHL